MMVWTTAIGVLAGLVAGLIVAQISTWLPIALEREWRKDAHEYLDLAFTPEPANTEKGFFISWRFLIIELLCSAVGGGIFWCLGLSIESVIYAVLFWSLITIAVIDTENLYIPDLIVLPLVWAGMLFYAVTAPDQLQWHVFGAAAGYGAFRWLPVGRGDAKLCALAGAWVGLQSLLTFLMIGACLGVAVGLIALCIRGESRQCPYAPSLAASLMFVLSVQLLGIEFFP